MATEDLKEDLARIAERTREMLEGEQIRSEEAKAMLEDLLASIGYDSEGLRRELEKLAQAQKR